MPNVQVGPTGGSAPIDEPPPDTPPNMPSGPPQDQGPGGGAPTYGGVPKPQSSSASSTDHTWDGIASGYQTELEDLALQWQQLAGFGMTIDEATLRKMADAHVISLRDMGQWLWNSGVMPEDLKERTPWLAFGIDQTTWNQQLGQYEDMYEQITGQRLNFGLNIGAAEAADPGNVAIVQAFMGNLSQSAFREALLHDQRIMSTYGWVKFGLDFDTFQQRKVDMRMQFGQDLSNDQAVLQLQYLHQAQGSGRAVTAAAPQGQQAGPVTPTEVEVR